MQQEQARPGRPGEKYDAFSAIPSGDFRSIVRAADEVDAVGVCASAESGKAMDSVTRAASETAEARLWLDMGPSNRQPTTANVGL